MVLSSDDMIIYAENTKTNHPKIKTKHNAETPVTNKQS